MSEKLKLLAMSGVEYVYLVLLWMAFVSKADTTELKVGLIVAFVGTVADAIVKAEGLGHFRPELRLLFLTFLEPWYVAKGLWMVLRQFRTVLKRDSGRPLKEVPFDEGQKEPQSAARRALAVMLLTIPPNSIVIGIDFEKRTMLLHEMEPEPTSLMARELGVQA